MARLLLISLPKNESMNSHLNVFEKKVFELFGMISGNICRYVENCIVWFVVIQWSCDIPVNVGKYRWNVQELAKELFQDSAKFQIMLQTRSFRILVTSRDNRAELEKCLRMRYFVLKCCLGPLGASAQAVGATNKQNEILWGFALDFRDDAVVVRLCADFRGWGASCEVLSGFPGHSLHRK